MRFLVSREEDGMRLLAVVTRHAAGIPLPAQKQALRAREIRIDGRRTDQDERVFAGQEIRAYFPQKALAGPPALEPERIKYLDDAVCVIDKPQGLQSCADEDACGADTALERTKALLRTRKERDSLYPCHRLDVWTGGLLVFARHEESLDQLEEAFRIRTLQKTYECLVKGCPQKKEATLTGYLRKDAANARVSVTDYPCPGAVPIMTRYRVLEEGGVSRLSVDLLTGRTHQIRAHLAHIGHPILGDDKYGDRRLNRAHRVFTQRLYAVRLVFDGFTGRLEPLNGRVIETVCPF